MDPVSETPTAPTDYAVLSLGYGALLAGVVASGRRREPIPSAELLPMSAAAFTLSKMVVHEKVEAWMRAPFVHEGDGRRPKGRRLRYAVGELLTCTRCTGAWAALGLVALRTHAPRAGRTVTTVLATSAGNDFAHAAFSLLCAGTNVKDATTELASRHADAAGNGAARESRQST